MTSGSGSSTSQEGTPQGGTATFSERLAVLETRYSQLLKLLSIRSIAGKDVVVCPDVLGRHTIAHQSREHVFNVVGYEDHLLPAFAL